MKLEGTLPTVNMWCKKTVLILLFIFNCGESVPEDPATSKSVGDDLDISMPTNTQYVANNSKLAVTCKMKFQSNGNPANLKFVNGDDGLGLTSKDRLKISITNDNANKKTIGEFVWDPIYVKDNIIKTVHCRNDDTKGSKTFRIVVIPSASVPKVKVLNGSDIKVNWYLPQSKVVCQVQCKKSSVVKDCSAQWMVGDLTSRVLPDGVTSAIKVIDTTTASAILQISDLTKVNGKKLYCVAQMKFVPKSEFEVVRSFNDFAMITGVGEAPKVTITNGTDIKLAWDVPQQKLVCQVQCKKIGNVKDCRGQWMINSAMSKVLPKGLTSTLNVLNNETTAAILQISNLGAVTGKKLYCVAIILFTSKNEFQLISSSYALATVTAIGEPPIVKLKKEVKVKDGEDAQLDCMATGPMAPKVKWWKQSERTLKGFLIEGDIKVKLDERFYYKKSDVVKGELSAKNSVIVIKDVTYADRSQFVCEAKYADRTVNTTFTLRVSDPLGVVWPIVGIIAEAILLVIIIWSAEYMTKKKKREEHGKRDQLNLEQKPPKDTEDAPLMKSNGDGANEVPA